MKIWVIWETDCKHIIVSWMYFENSHEYGLMQIEISDIQCNGWICVSVHYIHYRSPLTTFYTCLSRFWSWIQTIRFQCVDPGSWVQMSVVILVTIWPSGRKLYTAIGLWASQQVFWDRNILIVTSDIQEAFWRMKNVDDKNLVLQIKSDQYNLFWKISWTGYWIILSLTL